MVVMISFGLVLNIGMLVSLSMRSIENRGIGGFKLSSAFICSSVK
jgi:hypothetical protein